MMFETKVHGKWILAGEHSVLRGHPALVFPVKSRFMTLKHEPGTSAIKIQANNEDFEILASGLLEKALTRLGSGSSQLTGILKVENNVPVGAGMGASAVLCVSLCQFLVRQRLLHPMKLYDFAKSLEDIFHGESSGVDIAVAMAGKGLLFETSGKREFVEMGWQPNWYLSHCGTRGVTSDCIKQVKDLEKKDPKLFFDIDNKMHDCVVKAEGVLSSKNPKLNELAGVINGANECFMAWGLVSTDLKSHMQVLKDRGAIATKPTGSGGGGFVLSLWPKVPKGSPLELIPC